MCAPNLRIGQNGNGDGKGETNKATKSKSKRMLVWIGLCDPTPIRAGILRRDRCAGRGGGECGNEGPLGVSHDLEYVLGEGLYQRVVLYPVSVDWGKRIAIDRRICMPRIW